MDSISSGGLSSVDEEPLYSLITVTYNSAEALESAWGSIGPLPEQVQWIVVDNGSTDGSAELAERLGAEVIRKPQNTGFSAANNLGLTAATAPFIGFINPDVRVVFSDLPHLAEVAKARNAVVSPQLVNPDGSLQPNGRGYPFLLHKVRNRVGGKESLRGKYLLFAEGDFPREVCWVMGATVFASREVVDSLGGWDPHFFLYYEDKDICLRAWRAGFPVVLIPTVRWLHGWARETASISVSAWRRELASMAKFYFRYPEFLLGKAAAHRRHPLVESALTEDAL